MVEKDETGAYLYSGWVIHHARSRLGSYCGWILFSNAKRVRTSELNYHTDRCRCGAENADDNGENSSSIAEYFGKPPGATLTARDKRDLNDAITTMVLSTLRPYEIANEIFLHDLVSTALEVGARHGRYGAVTFDLSNSNKLIGGDGVRKNLDAIYTDVCKYWSSIVKDAHEKGLTSYYTDVGKDKINNRAMLNICVTFVLPALPDLI